MCDVNCPTLAVQVHTIFLLLVSYELFDIELAFNPVDAVCWPELKDLIFRLLIRRSIILPLVRSGLLVLFNL
jgi:hypothetical protein